MELEDKLASQLEISSSWHSPLNISIPNVTNAAEVQFKIVLLHFDCKYL